MAITKKQYAIVIGNIVAFIGLYYANKYLISMEERSKKVDEELGSIFAWGFGLSEDEISDETKGRFWSIKDDNNFPPKRIPLDMEDDFDMGVYNIKIRSKNEDEIVYDLVKKENDEIIGVVSVYPKESRLNFENNYKTN